MTKERKKLIAYLIVVIMLFGTGFGLGYYLWGVDREQKPDYKKYLSKTIDYIANIERDNRGFIEQIKGLKSKVAAINKDVKDAQSRSDAQSKSLQTRIASLEEEKARVQSLLGENQKLSKEKEQLQTKIDQLINELDIEVESPVSEKKEPAEQEVESHVSKEKISVEEKGPAEQEIESPVSKEKGQLEEKGHQSESLPD